MASWLLAATFLVRPAAAHEIENTHVLISFLASDEYRIEVLNDPDWLWMQFHPGAAELPPVDARDARLTALASQFAAGITLLFDDNPATPREVTYLPPLERDRSAPMGLAEPGLMRLSGTAPPGARTFQFGYDLVVDEYPLTVAPAIGAPVTRWLLAAQVSEAFDIGALEPLTRWQVATQYLGLGFTHILPKGLDHILFVLGLFLLSTRLKPLLLQVTAFTAAHTLTLALTIHGVFALPPSVVEPLIALSIAYVAVENLITSELQPSRVVLVFAFGLLHGMGFAGVLTDLGLPRSEFITALLTFNVGVEVGQLAVVAAAFAAVIGVRNRPWYRPRIVIPLSLAIAGVGLFWTVQRVVGA
jgi:hypothetical protein